MLIQSIDLSIWHTKVSDSITTTDEQIITLLFSNVVFIVNLLKDVDSIIRADLYLAKRFVVFEATLIDPVAMIQWPLILLIDQKKIERNCVMIICLPSQRTPDCPEFWHKS